MLSYTAKRMLTPKRPDAGNIESRAEAQVVPDPARCVQCGICSYNCPMEIDVRAHAHRGAPIQDSHCLTCSECVKRCPRGVLSFERIPLFTL
jgi:heterodisulfide reductase subunit C